MRIRILLAVILGIVAGVWVARATVQQLRTYPALQGEPQITVVHSGKSLTIKWNPVTHEEVRNETADGGVILTVQPKVKEIER